MVFKNALISVIILSTIVKFIAVFTFFDDSNINYWEYGIIAKNLINGKGYSLHYHIENKLTIDFDKASAPYPSAYMPPAYVYYLLPYMLINDTKTRNIVFLIIQVLISNFAVYLIFILTKMIFDDKIALISSTIYAFLPEFIYSNLIVGTTLFYHILILLFFILTIHKAKSETKNAILIAILIAIIIYLRAEFLFFAIILIIYFITKKKFGKSLIIVSILLILIIPWQYRNYRVFDTFVPFTTSSGLNFYRGHNPYEPGIWADEKIADSLNKLVGYKDFEVKMNQLYFDEAFRAISENPLFEIKNSIIKLFHLWIFNPNDSRSYHSFYFIPWSIFLLLSIYGLIKTWDTKNFAVFYIFILYHSLLAILFFALPRYQTMMKISILPFMAYSISSLYDIIKARKKTGD